MKNEFTLAGNVLFFLLALSFNISYGQILSYTNATSGALNSGATHAIGAP